VLDPELGQLVTDGEPCLARTNHRNGEALHASRGYNGTMPSRNSSPVTDRRPAA
jgi:hypothetical protein